MLFQFLVLSFGFVFTHRTIVFQIKRKPLSEAISRDVSRFLIFYFWFLTLLSPWMSVPLLLILLFVPNLAAVRLNWILNIILKRRFRFTLLQFVDEMILLMMTGKSFRDSFLQLTEDSNDFFHLKMREILLAPPSVGTSTPLASSDFHQLSQLVQVIEKNPHKAIDRLRSFRRQLHWDLLFKRKSKQATAQIRAQALILSILYIGLFVFVFQSQGGQMGNLLMSSLCLYLTGLLSLFILGRQHPWKT